MSEPEGSDRHPEPGEALAWLDGELPSGPAAELARHLETCESCVSLRRDLEAASASLAAAVRTADVAPRRPTVAAVRRRALYRRLAPVAAAAVLVVVFAGAASALVPGSPLRAWIERLSDDGPVSGEPERIREMATQLSVVAPDSVDVVLGEPRDSLEIHLVLSAGTMLEVETSRGDAIDRVELGSARLRVDPGSARLLRIRFPRTDRVRVLFRGRDLLGPVGGLPPTVAGSGDSIVIVRTGPATGGGGAR